MSGRATATQLATRLAVIAFVFAASIVEDGDHPNFRSSHEAPN